MRPRIFEAPPEFEERRTRRTNYSSGAKWESIVGYSRAVRVGNMIEVTGTVASDEDGNVVGENDAYEQSRYIFQKIEKVLARPDIHEEFSVRLSIFLPAGYIGNKHTNTYHVFH